MLDQEQIQKIKQVTEEFFAKTTINVFSVGVAISSEKSEKDDGDVVNLDIQLEEPQILIGQGGQTLFEIQRLLRMVLNKKIQQVFYLNLDINDYKKKKIEYLEALAIRFADEAVANKEERELPPMPPYERRIIHAQLSQRKDISTESRGEDLNRHIVIKPL